METQTWFPASVRCLTSSSSSLQVIGRCGPSSPMHTGVFLVFFAEEEAQFLQ